MSDYEDKNDSTIQNPSNPTIERPDFEITKDNSVDSTDQVPYEAFVDLPKETPPLKKKSKLLVGIFATVAGLAVCGVIAVFAIPSLKAAFSGNDLSPKERFRSAVEQMVAKETEQGSDLTAENFALPFDTNNFTFVSNIDVKLNPMISAMLPEDLQGLSLDNIGATFEVRKKMDLANMDFSLSLNNEQLLNVETYFNMALQQFFLRIPELSSSYLSALLTDVDTGMTDSAELFDFSSLSQSQLPSEEAMNSLLTELTEIFTNKIETVALTEDYEVTAAGINESFDKLTATLTNKDLKDILVASLNKIKANKELQDMVSSINELDNTGSTKFNLEEMINSMISEVTVPDSEDETTLDFSIFLDENDDITGFDLSGYSEEPKDAFGYITATDKKTGVELYILAGDNEKVVITSNYENDTTGYKGFVEFNVENSSEVVQGIDPATSFIVNFENVKTVDKEKHLYSGSYFLSTPSQPGVSIGIILEVKDSVQQVGLDVSAMGQSLVSITCSLDIREGAEIVEPDSSEAVFQITDYEQYMLNADLIPFITELGDKLGIDLLSMFYGEMLE